jgi:hypothetical protein
VITGDFNRVFVSVAQSHVGLKETSRNSGPVIDGWLAGVGQLPGASWCAAAVHGCAGEAASALGIANPCPKTASVLKLWERLQRCRVPMPFPGCLYFVSHGKGQGHVGIIETVAPSGLVEELSGNTNAAGSREGNAFERHEWLWMLKKAHGGDVLGYADLEMAMADGVVFPPGLPPSPFGAAG